MLEILIWILLFLTTITLTALIFLLRTLKSSNNSKSVALESMGRDVEKSIRAQEAVHRFLVDGRREASDSSRQQREESAKSMNNFRSAILDTMTKLSDAQKGMLETFGGGLTKNSQSSLDKIDKLSEGVEAKLAKSQEVVGSRLDLSRAELAAAAKQSRDELAASLKSLQVETGIKLDKMRDDGSQSAKATRQESAKLVNDFSEQLLAKVGEVFKTQNERLEQFSRRVSQMVDANDKKGDSLRVAVETKLKEMREENVLKLEEMRKTVDEKLQGTLEKRLGESFKQVSDRLEQVHKGLGEMQTLANGVGDLKRVMTNVKTRGTWGEVALGALLEQLLTPEQYEVNVAPKPNSGERVEFAVCLPGRTEEGRVVYLPLDAKFPSESYQRLVEAQEEANSEAVALSVKQLENAVKSCAKDISGKYISPPHTTDFAIMFLPSEGLYAEVVRRTGLVEFCQRECRVVIAGPTTLAALLNSLQMGFRTLAIQKRSSEVWEVLGAVKTEFGKFGGVLQKVKKKLQEAGNTIESAEVRTRAMNRKLRSVEAMPGSEASNLLGVDVEVDE